MSEHHHVVVAGGGVAGAGCLYQLAQRGVRDCLLLEQAGLASGSSGRSAAFIETQYLDESRIRLCTWSLELYEWFARARGLRLAQIGKLLLSFTRDDCEAFDRSLACQRELGVDDSRVLDSTAVRRMFPQLRADDVVAALWGPRDGYTDPSQLCRIYVAGAEAVGCAVQTATQIVAIRARAGSGFELKTDRGPYTCEILINCAGAWAGALGSMMGLTIPVDGHRRQVVSLAFDPPATASMPIVVVPATPGDDATLYFRNDGDGRLLAGLHSETGGRSSAEHPDSYEREGDPGFQERLAARVKERLQAASKPRIVGGWSGLYPLSPDGELILGEVKAIPGFYNAVALGGNGIQLSAAVGRIVADLVVDGASELLPDPGRYGLERFDRVPT